MLVVGTKLKDIKLGVFFKKVLMFVLGTAWDPAYIKFNRLWSNVR